MVPARTFFVGALHLVGEGRAMGTPGLPTFFEDADWDTGIVAKLSPGTTFVLLDLFLLPIPPCNILSSKACRLYNCFSVNRRSSWSSNSLFNMGSVYPCIYDNKKSASCPCTCECWIAFLQIHSSQWVSPP